VAIPEGFEPASQRCVGLALSRLVAKRPATTE
jgi:hypothetical protein